VHTPAHRANSATPRNTPHARSSCTAWPLTSVAQCISVRTIPDNPGTHFRHTTAYRTIVRCIAADHHIARHAVADYSAFRHVLFRHSSLPPISRSLASHHSIPLLHIALSGDILYSTGQSCTTVAQYCTAPNSRRCLVPRTQRSTSAQGRTNSAQNAASCLCNQDIAPRKHHFPQIRI
jgi:hypothetical protein